LVSELVSRFFSGVPIDLVFSFSDFVANKPRGNLGRGIQNTKYGGNNFPPGRNKEIMKYSGENKQ
jgi:hypothetical protein